MQNILSGLVLLLLLAANLSWAARPPAKSGEFSLVAAGASASRVQRAELAEWLDAALAFAPESLKLVAYRQRESYRYQSIFLSGFPEGGQAELLPEMPGKSARGIPMATLASPVSSRRALESPKSVLVLGADAPADFDRVLLELARKAATAPTGRPIALDITPADARAGSVGLKDTWPWPAIDFARSSWAVDTHWHRTFCVEYRLSYEGKEFSVEVFPKQFGGTSRSLPALRKIRAVEPDAIFVNTGKSFEEDRPVPNRAFLEELHRIGVQAYAVGYEELMAKRTVLDPYSFEHKDDPKRIRFVSVNAYVATEPQAARLFEPYVLVEKNGIRIAFVGVTSPHAQEGVDKNRLLDAGLQGVQVREPGPILAREALPELRSKADWIVLVGNLRPESLTAIDPYIDGVDLVVNRSAPRLNGDLVLEAQAAGFRNRSPRLPLLRVEVSQVAVSRVRAQMVGAGARVHAESLALGMDQEDEQPLSLETSRETVTDVLLDHRVLYPSDPSRARPSREEFARFAASMMRQGTRSELGIFNVQEQGEQKIGPSDVATVRSWVRPSETLVILYLPGSALLELKKAQFGEEDQLAISGFDANGGVHGSPIQPNELYRVATSSAVSERLGAYPFMSAAKAKSIYFRRNGANFSEDPDGEPVNLAQAIVEVARSKPAKTEADREELRAAYEARPVLPEGLWTLDMKEIGLEYSQISNSTDPRFSQVLDSRVSSAPQSNLGAKILVSGIYKDHPTVTEIGTKMLYGRTRIRKDPSNVVTNELADDLVVFADSAIPWLTLPAGSGLGRTGPFVNLSFDSEFAPAAGKLRETLLNGLLGWRTYEGRVVKSISLGALMEADLSQSGRRDFEYGYGASALAEQSLADDRLLWRVESNMKYLLPRRTDTPDDLKLALSVDVSLKAKLFGCLYLGPYYRTFVYSSKTFDASASQSVFGVSLSLVRAWKPAFQPFVF